MSTNSSSFSQDSNNYTSLNLLILTGAALGSIMVLIAAAFLCGRLCRRRYQYQNITVITTTPNLHSLLNGLSRSTIANLPTFGYTRHRNDGGGWLQCAVCLSIVQEGEEVRQLPTCKHLFHRDCIDLWLYSHSTCPLCRSKVEAMKEVKVRGSGNTASSPVPPV